MAKAIEKAIRARAGERCEYCQLAQRFSKLAFVIDHIIASQHGGSDAVENLALACGFCNLHKGPNIAGIDPQSNSLSRLFHPRRDRWEEHFRLNGPRIIGATEIGPTTISVLAMNHPHQIAIRQALADEGVYPSS